MWDLVLDGLVKVLHKLGMHSKQKTDQLTTLGTRGIVLEIAKTTRMTMCSLISGPTQFSTACSMEEQERSGSFSHMSDVRMVERD